MRLDYPSNIADIIDNRQLIDIFKCSPQGRWYLQLCDRLAPFKGAKGLPFLECHHFFMKYSGQV